MWSRETFATLVSMISMSVGSMTVTATIHLLSRTAPTAFPMRFPPFTARRGRARWAPRTCRSGAGARGPGRARARSWPARAGRSWR